MGACASADAGDLTPEEKAARKKEAKRAQQIDSQMNNEHNQDAAINKLLLLGAGESGKSTLFKQMITIYGKGFSDDDRRGYVSIIYNNILTSMKTLVIQAEVYNVTLGAPAQEAKKLFENVKMDEDMNPPLGEAIKTLWLDAAMQGVYERRAEYQLTDSAE